MLPVTAAVRSYLHVPKLVSRTNVIDRLALAQLFPRSEKVSAASLPPTLRHHGVPLLPAAAVVIVELPKVAVQAPPVPVPENVAVLMVPSIRVPLFVFRVPSI